MSATEIYKNDSILKDFISIIIAEESEIREELAKITDIPQEHIAYSKVNNIGFVYLKLELSLFLNWHLFFLLR